jgi:hypothetical protein
MKIVFYLLMFILYTFFSPELKAVSVSDSIINIPKGTIFKLRYELEVPANQNFLFLGGNQLQESFNEVNQYFNQNNNNYYNRHNYFTYNSYLRYWQESVHQSYLDCIERHRSYYSYGGNLGSSNNVIVNHGYGNTNIIVNNQANNQKTYGSYINKNTCIMPEHTIALLLLNKNKIQSGGIFRDGYEFKVRSVKYRKNGDFYNIDILFNHKVAKGIRIITTQSPKYIPISSLQATTGQSNSFWSSVGSALASLVDIGGDNFDIYFPELKYFE